MAKTTDGPSARRAEKNSADAEAKVDGRTARRDRNRDLVADAFLDLMAEGIAEPTHEMVAARSGVSLRSVFRYWDGSDEMYRSVFLRAHDRVTAEVPYFEPTNGDLQARSEAFVDNRIGRLLSAGNWGRVVRMREPIDGMPSEVLEEVVTRVMSNIRAQFAPELDQMSPERAATAAAVIYQTCSYEGMDLLMRQLAFTPAQIRTAAVQTIKAILMNDDDGAVSGG